MKVALAQITGEPFGDVAVDDQLREDDEIGVAFECLDRGGACQLSVLLDRERERLAPLAEPLLGPTFESWHELQRALRVRPVEALEVPLEVRHVTPPSSVG